MQNNLHKLQVQLDSIQEMISRLDEQTYTFPITEMGNASIGQHVRHTLEIILELLSGYTIGRVDYSKRKRDLKIETIPNYAQMICQEIGMKCLLPNRLISLIEKDFEDEVEEIPSSYAREIHFVLDHTIHHMALIKTGLRILNDDSTNDSFGMAYSTIKHRKTICAQ